MIAALVKVIVAVILATIPAVPAGKVLIDCEDYEFKTPCFTIDEGHERIILRYDPYTYVNLS